MVRGSTYQQGDRFFQHISALHPVYSSLTSLWESLPPLSILGVFPSFQCYLSIVTRENDAPSCFGYLLPDKFFVVIQLSFFLGKIQPWVRLNIIVRERFIGYQPTPGWWVFICLFPVEFMFSVFVSIYYSVETQSCITVTSHCKIAKKQLFLGF